MIDFESNSLSDGKVGVGNEQLISSGTQSGLSEHDSSFSDGSAEANILGDPSLQLGINAGEESDQSITMNAQRGEAISPSEDTGHTTSDLLGEDNTNASSTIDRKSVRVPMQAFSSAMRLCVATGDMNSADRLLDSLRDPRNTIPLTKKIEVFTLALKGYAKTGNSDAAQDLLKDMQIRGLNPT
jgi:pentatricopeptide repeat protein